MRGHSAASPARRQAGRRAHAATSWVDWSFGVGQAAASTAASWPTVGAPAGPFGRRVEPVPQGYAGSRSGEGVATVHQDRRRPGKSQPARVVLCVYPHRLHVHGNSRPVRGRPDPGHDNLPMRAAVEVQQPHLHAHPWHHPFNSSGCVPNAGSCRRPGLQLSGRGCVRGTPRRSRTDPPAAGRSCRRRRSGVLVRAGSAPTAGPFVADALALGVVLVDPRCRARRRPWSQLMRRRATHGRPSCCQAERGPHRAARTTRLPHTRGPGPTGRRSGRGRTADGEAVGSSCKGPP